MDGQREGDTICRTGGEGGQGRAGRNDPRFEFRGEGNPSYFRVRKNFKPKGAANKEGRSAIARERSLLGEEGEGKDREGYAENPCRGSRRSWLDRDKKDFARDVESYTKKRGAGDDFSF